MSEDQTNQPNIPNPAPKKVTPPPIRQSFLKAQSIKILRGTIRLLEGTVEKLEEPPTATSQITTAKPSLLERFLSLWNGVIGIIRSFLPTSLNQKLSDTALSGAIAVVLVLLLWTTTTLISGKPTEVAEVPPAATPVPEQISSPEPTPVPVAPVPEPTPPPANIDTPPELKAPEAPQAVEIAPPPPPVLTPEQKLIASIQDQVAQTTTQYANGLIGSIQANFPASLLVVQVSDAWYDLNLSKQDNLAGEMLQRAKELDFSKLEISDSQGTLLARSPVVGDKMVILKRRVLAAG